MKPHIAAVAMQAAESCGESTRVLKNRNSAASAKAQLPIQRRPERRSPIQATNRSLKNPPSRLPSAAPVNTILDSQPASTFDTSRAAIRYLGYQNMYM